MVSGGASRRTGSAARTAGLRAPGLVGPVALGFLLYLAAQAFLLVAGGWSLSLGEVLGPDAWMRLNRVLECRGGATCPGGLYPRSNAPFGEVLHWPWLLDRLILLLAAPAVPFVGIRQAVLLAAHLVGPLSALLALALAAVGGRALLGGFGAALVPALLAVQLWMHLTFSVLRPDHHGLQLAFQMGGLAFGLRLLGRAAGRRDALAAGLFLGLAAWTSVEGLVTLAPLLLVLASFWLVSGSVELAGRNRDLYLAAVAVLLPALLLDAPPEGLAAPVLDRLSIVHLVLIATVGAFWALMARVPPRAVGGRVVASSAGVVAALALPTALAPGFLRGPMAEVHPELFDSWLSRMTEFHPLLGRGDPTWAAAWLVPVALACAVAFALALRRRGERRGGWAVVAMNLLAFGAMAALVQVRWVHYAYASVPFVLGWILARAVEAVEDRVPRHLVAVVGVATVFLAPGVVLGVLGGDGAEAAASEAPGCSARLASRLLDPLPATVVLAPAPWGPEILFRTDHRVLGTPYHRNDAGMLYGREVMRAPPAEARALLRQRNVGAVVFCREVPWSPWVRPDEPGSLYRALQAGRRPPWLRPAGGEESLRVLRVAP